MDTDGVLRVGELCDDGSTACTAVVYGSTFQHPHLCPGRCPVAMATCQPVSAAGRRRRRAHCVQRRRHFHTHQQVSSITGEVNEQ